MKISLPLLLRSYTLIGSLKNRIFNAVASAVTGSKVAVDWHGVKLLHPESIRIGDRFSSGRGLWLESVEGRGQLVIGRQVNLSDHVHIGCALSVTIGDGVLVGSKVLITDHSHGRIGPAGPAQIELPPNQRDISSKGAVAIGDNVWIGDNACILQGVSIGEGAIIGANSVVVRNVPARTIWAGAPARQVWPAPSAAS